MCVCVCVRVSEKINICECVCVCVCVALKIVTRHTRKERRRKNERTCSLVSLLRMALVFFSRKSIGINFPFPLLKVRADCFACWFVTVKTRAMALRTTVILATLAVFPPCICVVLNYMSCVCVCVCVCVV